MSNLKKIFLVKLKGHFWVGMFSRLKLTKHVPGIRFLNDFQVKLTMGHVCKIFQVGKVKAEQLKRADGSVEVWSRWQRRLVQAPARGLHSVQSTLMFRF